MLGLLKGLTRQGKIDQMLLRFYEELKKNLELYHVHDQRQFIDKEFRTEEWAKVKSVEAVQGAGKIQIYGKAIEDFNRFFHTFRGFEKWYAADMANKTKENAQKLHTQRAELDGKLKDLYPIICQAGEQLEYKLIDLGLIKR